MMPTTQADPHGSLQHLVEVVQQLSLATELVEVVDVVRHAARDLAGADGATFVLRDGDRCHYVDEDAIGPLWRGQKFPIDVCISGWAMKNAQHVVLEDIYADARIPVDAYRPTFVKSLAMMPIRRESPIGAIGVYWATHRRATDRELDVLQALAHSTSVALTNVELVRNLRSALDETRHARDQLAHQLKLRDDFIALAAHELRTPLTPLHFQLHRIHRAASDASVNEPVATKILGAVGVAEGQLADLGELAERLLDVSRISMGRLELTRTSRVSLATIVGNAVSRIRKPGDVAIHAELDESLEGRWDGSRLEQVFDVLLDNALKFGGGRDVTVATGRDGGSIVAKVVDRGIGIPRDALASIFERFARAAETTSYRGLGFGLFIARGIVDAHGGTLSVESEPGVGSTFTVRLPAGS